MVLQKKEEEAFGFEIQVRLRFMTCGRISQPPRLILTGFDLITADDSWVTEMWTSDPAFNLHVCVRWRGGGRSRISQITGRCSSHDSREEEIIFFPFFPPVFISSCVVCSHDFPLLPSHIWPRTFLPCLRRLKALCHLLYRPQSPHSFSLKKVITLTWGFFFSPVIHLLPSYCLWKWSASSRKKTYCSIYGLDGGSHPSCLPVAWRKWDREDQFDS